MQIATTSPSSQAQDTFPTTPSNISAPVMCLFLLFFFFLSQVTKPSICVYQSILFMKLHSNSIISMDEQQQHQKEFSLLPKPSNFVSKLVSFQADLIYNSMVSVFSPVQSLFSSASTETKDNVESSSLLKKLGLGFLSAAYVCMVLVLVLVLASVVGVGLVRFWVEEPVFVKENLHFDYTDSNPSAVFQFDGGVSGFQGYYPNKKHIFVPVGHKFEVSLVLLMPESDFNRDLGVFQVAAELLSVNENMIAKSSQPCMLRYRSSPVRLARTVMMGFPLVLGFSGETQKLNVEILRHKEGYNRTKSIRVTLHPRAGSLLLPQIYEAEIVVKSHLPWAKELVRNWKWTFYVWVSLYIYIMSLLFLLCCYRPLLFFVTPDIFSDQRVVSEIETSEEINREVQVRELGDESEVTELLRKWRRSRRKRKEGSLDDDSVPETIGSSASSISMSTTTTREDVTSFSVEDEVEDSESVCLG